MESTVAILFLAAWTGCGQLFWQGYNRGDLRRQYDLADTPSNDYLVSCCCSPCALGQEDMEVRRIERARLLEYQNAQQAWLSKICNENLIVNLGTLLPTLFNILIFNIAVIFIYNPETCKPRMKKNEKIYVIRPRIGLGTFCVLSRCHDQLDHRTNLLFLKIRSYHLKHRGIHTTFAFKHKK